MLSITKCPICQRELGEINVDEHHLLPKTFKGRETVLLHKICHKTIHSLIRTRELFTYYYTVERILEREDIQKFVAWIKNKPLDFDVKSKESNGRKKHR